MKIRNLSFFVFLFMGFSLQAQQINKQNTAISFFWVNLDENLGVMQNKAFYDSLYTELTNALVSEGGYTLHPVSDLKNKVPFHMLGYPLASGKKAGKSGVAETYLKFQIQIVPNGIFTTRTTTVGSGSVAVGTNKTKAKIKVKIDATVYDAKGKKIKEAESVCISENEIEVSQDLFSYGNFTQTSYNEDITKMESFGTLVSSACLSIAKSLK